MPCIYVLLSFKTILECISSYGFASQITFSLNLGNLRPNFDSIPANIGAATAYPPMWSLALSKTKYQLKSLIPHTHLECCKLTIPLVVSVCDPLGLKSKNMSQNWGLTQDNDRYLDPPKST